MEYEKKLSEFFSSCDGKILNVFFSAYSIVEKLDTQDQPAAVRFLCEKAYKMRSDYSKRIDKDYYTSEQVEKAERKVFEEFIPKLNKLINSSAKQSTPELVFYTQVWHIIQSSMFKTKRERALALFGLADHQMIPYRCVGIGQTMTDEEFGSVVDSLDEAILEDSSYIIKLDYAQKTERASLLVDKLLALDNKTQQSVYLAIIMHEIENNIREQIKSTLEKI